MAEVKPMTVKMEALKYHTTDGKEYNVGDTYDVPDHAVDNLVAQGMATRVDRVAHARREASAAATPAKTAKAPRATKPRKSR